MKSFVLAAAVSAWCLSVAAVSITPTKVKVSGGENALYPHYEVSGATSACGGLVVFGVIVANWSRRRKS